MKNFTPYSNESDAITIGGLNIENRLDRVSIYGSIDLTRDQAGLDHARRLQEVLADTVRALEADKNLPRHLPAPEPPTAARDPFA